MFYLLFRRSLLTSLFIACTFLSYAQVSLGVHGASGISMGFFNPIRLQQSVTTSGGGLSFTYYHPAPRYKEDKLMGLQVDLTYRNKGVLLLTEDEVPHTFEHKVSVIELPMLTQFRAGGKHVKFLMEGGAYGAYALKNNKSTDFTSLEVALYGYHKDTMNVYEYGLAGGAGFAFLMGRSSLQLHARYMHSLTNFFAKQTSWDRSVSQYQQVSFSVAFLFSPFSRRKEPDPLIPAE